MRFRWEIYDKHTTEYINEEFYLAHYLQRSMLEVLGHTSKCIEAQSLTRIEPGSLVCHLAALTIIWRIDITRRISSVHIWACVVFMLIAIYY
jgi:hypothetical protein